MKSQQISETYFGSPVWLHSESAFHFMLPNGARLKAGSVPASYMNTVKSGSLVGRIAGNKKFELLNIAATDLLSVNRTTLIVAAEIGATTLFVADVDGYAAGQAIRVGGEARTISAVDMYRNTITITAGVTTAKAVGVDVVLATGLAYSELALMLTDITNVTVNDDFTILRTGADTQIYINFLPRFNEMSTFLKGEIVKRYQAYNGRL